jgi:hypothetical protein
MPKRPLPGLTARQVRHADLGELRDERLDHVGVVAVGRGARPREVALPALHELLDRLVAGWTLPLQRLAFGLPRL